MSESGWGFLQLLEARLLDLPDVIGNELFARHVVFGGIGSPSAMRICSR
jgi:hypothetical protein